MWNGLRMCIHVLVDIKNLEHHSAKRTMNSFIKASIQKTHCKEYYINVNIKSHYYNIIANVCTCVLTYFDIIMILTAFIIDEINL